MPKKAPEASPIRAGFSVQLLSSPEKLIGLRATEIAITPIRLIRIAAAPLRPSGSPRTTMPKIAVCTVSVLE